MGPEIDIPTIDITVEHDAWAALGDLDALARRAVDAAVAAAAIEVPAGAELSLVLCDDAFIRALNRNWRGKDKPTNVLSFPTAEPMLLGDVVVAYETSAAEAVEAGRPLADHLSHLLVHGFLHLVGHDHEAEAEADTMEGLESRALLALGIASPYHEVEDTSAHP